MRTDEKTITKEYEYTSKLQESLHRFMLKIIKESITKDYFNSSEELKRRFRDYNNYEFIINRWIYGTFFLYQKPELQYIYRSKEEFQKSQDVIGWLLKAMTVTPPDKPVVEKPKEPKIEKKAVSFEELGIDEPEEKEEKPVKTSKSKHVSKAGLHEYFADLSFEKIVILEVLGEGVFEDRNDVLRTVSKASEDLYLVGDEEKPKSESKEAVTFED